MTVSQKINPLFVVTAVLFSGLCWYLSNGLTGDYWYLLWIAPVPVLALSFRLPAKAAFIISFIAYLLGRLSWFSYLVSVATLIPAIIFTLVLPLIFSLIILQVRKIITRSPHWWTVFAFPVLFTSFEFLVARFSPDGSAASIAYTQSNVLSLIQVASVTGIAGITFIVIFFPSAIAVAWYYRKEKNKLRYITVSSIVILAAVFSFGLTRINNNKKDVTVKAGLAVLDEKFHYITGHPDLQKEIQSAEYYAAQIKKLSEEAAQVIVLPERAVNITPETDSAVMHILMTAAKQNHVVLVTGYTNFKNKPQRNSAMVINADGGLVTGYNKAHLVTGLENQFTAGNEIAVFQFNNLPAGVAICKDLDFPAYIRRYGEKSVHFLCIPAWDFSTDDWLHSRMAILRGVEIGCSEIRSARLGRLTISDFTGRVNFETSSTAGHAASLTGDVSLEKRNTVYSRFGDWFGWLNLIMAVCFIFFTGKNQKKKPELAKRL